MSDYQLICNIFLLLNPSVLADCLWPHSRSGREPGSTSLLPGGGRSLGFSAGNLGGAPHLVWSPPFMTHLSCVFRAWREEAALCQHPLPCLFSLQAPVWKGHFDHVCAVQHTLSCFGEFRDWVGEDLVRRRPRKSSCLAPLKSISMLHGQGRHFFHSSSCCTDLKAPALRVPDPQVGTTRLPPNTTLCCYCPQVPKLWMGTVSRKIHRLGSLTIQES